VTFSEDLADPEDLIKMAVEDAREHLEQRGLDPDDFPRLLERIGCAAEQLWLANKMGRDPADFSRYLNALFDRLDDVDLVDDLRGIMPPRRTLSRDPRWWRA
jgi:hypothetical protein